MSTPAAAAAGAQAVPSAPASSHSALNSKPAPLAIPRANIVRVSRFGERAERAKAAGASVVQAVADVNLSQLRTLLQDGCPWDFILCLRTACDAYKAESAWTWRQMIDCLVRAYVRRDRLFDESVLDLDRMPVEQNPLASLLHRTMVEQWGETAFRLMIKCGAPFSMDVFEAILSQPRKYSLYGEIFALEFGHLLSSDDIHHPMCELLIKHCYNADGTPRWADESKVGMQFRPIDQQTDTSASLLYLLRLHFRHHAPARGEDAWLGSLCGQQCALASVGELQHRRQVRHLLVGVYNVLLASEGPGELRRRLWCTRSFSILPSRCIDLLCWDAHSVDELLHFNPSLRLVDSTVLQSCCRHAHLCGASREASSGDLRIPTPAALAFLHRVIYEYGAQSNSAKETDLYPLFHLLLALQTYVVSTPGPRVSDLFPVCQLVVSLLQVAMPTYFVVHVRALVDQLRDVADAKLRDISDAELRNASGALLSPKAVDSLEKTLNHLFSEHSRRTKTQGPMPIVRQILSLLPHAAVHASAVDVHFLQGWPQLRLSICDRQDVTAELLFRCFPLYLSFPTLPTRRLPLPPLLSTSGRFLLEQTSAEGAAHPVSFTRFQYVFHDAKELLPALRLVSQRNCFPLHGSRHPSYPGPSLLWLTPQIDLTKLPDSISAANLPPSLDSSDSRYGTIRVSFPIRHALRQHQNGYQLGTRQVEHFPFPSAARVASKPASHSGAAPCLEWTHAVLLSDQSAYAIGNPFGEIDQSSAAWGVPSPVVSDCALPLVEHHPGACLVQWDADAPVMATWHCSRVSAGEWDQLKFAIPVSGSGAGGLELPVSLDADPDSADSVRIDFVTHSRLCAVPHKSGGDGKDTCQTSSMDDTAEAFVKVSRSKNIDLSKCQHVFGRESWTKIQYWWEKSKPQIADLEAASAAAPSSSSTAPASDDEKSLPANSPKSLMADGRNYSHWDDDEEDAQLLFAQLRRMGASKLVLRTLSDLVRLPQFREQMQQRDRTVATPTRRDILESGFNKVGSVRGAQSSAFSETYSS